MPRIRGDPSKPIPKNTDAPNHKTRLSNKQREDIAIYYYSHDVTQAALAKQYGICQASLHNIVNNPKWMKKANEYISKEMQKADLRKKLTQLKAVRAAPDAMDKIIEIARQKVTKENMPVQYVIQNACNAILDRAGVKAQVEAGDEIVIRFADQRASFVPGMPDMESPMIDVTGTAESSDNG